jgi:hypothetical protein
LFSSGFELEGDYPFTLKTGDKTSITFMTNTDDPANPDEKDVVLFNADTPTSFTTQNLDEVCITGKEKGAIYFNGYYYLSCLDSLNSNQFKIKIYDNTYVNKYIVPGTYTLKSGSSVRFFIKYSSKVFVCVAWLSDENHLELIELDQGDIISQSSFTVNNIARDTDCIFVSSYQRIVCGFGFLNQDLDIYQCSLNIFVGGEGVVDITSNLKIYEKCQSHHSRKLRADKDLSVGGDIFYYYFVGTDNNAYVSKAEMTSIAAISLSNPKHSNIP